jgi:hypothetical protein
MQRLDLPSETEPLVYLDLRRLIADCPIEELGTTNDRRFRYLREAVESGREIEVTEQLYPQKQRGTPCTLSET